MYEITTDQEWMWEKVTQSENNTYFEPSRHTISRGHHERKFPYIWCCLEMRFLGCFVPNVLDTLHWTMDDSGSNVL